MARNQGWFALILALAIAASWCLFANPLKLGLDLSGGSQLLLEVQPAGDITKITSEELESVKAVLDLRVNGLGVAESTLQTIGDDQLVVELPGETDPSRAAKTLGETALLEFRAQKPGTEDEMKNLLRLRDQVKSILELKQSKESEGPESALTPEELAKAQKASAPKPKKARKKKATASEGMRV